MNITLEHKSLLNKLDNIILSLTNNAGHTIPIYRNEYIRYQIVKKQLENSNKTSVNASNHLQN